MVVNDQECVGVKGQDGHGVLELELELGCTHGRKGNIGRRKMFSGPYMSVL